MTVVTHGISFVPKGDGGAFCPYLEDMMANRFDSLPNRRAIINRRRLADALAGLAGDNPAALRAAATPLLREALDHVRAEIARRLADKPSHGAEIAASYAFLT